MDGNATLTFIILLFLIACSAFFSSAETAYTCLNRVRLKNMASSGNKRAERVLALAQCIGRWGNYFNGEAHGGPTDLPWAIYVDGQYVHPTFLYESIWCFLLFIFLLWMDNMFQFDRSKWNI